MARILLALSNAVPVGKTFRPVCFYEQLINSFLEEGNDIALYIPNKFHTISVFNSENVLQPNINEDHLIHDIKSFNPELVIAFNNAIYRNILNITDCRVVVWDSDFYPLWNQRDLIKANLERYVFFSFVDYYRKKEQEFFKFKDSQSLVVPQGTGMKNTHAEKTANISFIGTNFGTPQKFVKFIQKHSGEADFKKLLGLIKTSPFSDKQLLLKSIADKEIRKDFQHFSQEDLLYFFSGEDRIKVLLALSNLGLDLYAVPAWNETAVILPSLAACDTRKFVYSLKDNEDIYNTSKLCLNINHTQAAFGMSWRVLDILATGGCLVSSESSYIRQTFGSYVDLPMFDNSYDAHILCQKLLKEDNWRSDIVAASNIAVEKEGRWHGRFKQMEDFLNIPMTALNKKGSLTVLEPVFDEGNASTVQQSILPHSKRKMSLRYKIIYKIWKHLDKKLRKKSFIP